MGILSKIFTWWDGATIGTALYSARNGQFMGEDDLGNRYYQSRDGSRRWVMYNGSNDAARVAPEWHGWLHNTFEGEPETYLPPVRSFEIASAGNPTGTVLAYRPGGALERGGARAPSTGDYQAWSPEG